MRYIIEVAVAVVQFGLSFYAFWLVWRVLLPDLPGPHAREKRIAPFAGYFTDPFIVPVARVFRVPPRFVAFLLLVLIAAMSVALGVLPRQVG